MKTKTFTKNVVVMAISLVLTVIFATLVHMSAEQIITGITLLLAFGSTVLILEDVARKLLQSETRESVTWQYFVGILLMLISVVMFLFMSVTETWTVLIFRGIGLLVVGTLASVWMRYAYWPSVMSPEEKETRAFERAKAKLKVLAEKEGGREKAMALLMRTLRFRLANDSIDGDLDFEDPLAVYHDACLTYTELMEEEEKSDADEELIVQLKTVASDYIESLVQGFK